MLSVCGAALGVDVWGRSSSRFRQQAPFGACLHRLESTLCRMCIYTCVCRVYTAVYGMYRNLVYIHPGYIVVYMSYMLTYFEYTVYISIHSYTFIYTLYMYVIRKVPVYDKKGLLSPGLSA